MLEIKNKQQKTNTEAVLKSAFDEIIKRLDTVEERILKIWKEQQQKTKTEKKHTQNIQRLWDNYKMYTMHITNILGEIEKGTEEIFDTMSENFPNLILDTKPLIQEVQRTASRINSPSPHPSKKMHLSI